MICRRNIPQRCGWNLPVPGYIGFFNPFCVAF
jgi:hypothetical protein